MTREELLVLLGKLSDENAGDVAWAIQSMGQPPVFARIPGCPTWCTCGRCEEMEDRRMRVCCRSNPCLSLDPSFCRICLSPGVILVAGILNYAAQFHDVPTFEARHYRNRAYRFFILWQYGKLNLSRKVRRCPPSCIVRVVRQRFPAPDERYIGYESMDEFNLDDEEADGDDEMQETQDTEVD